MHLLNSDSPTAINAASQTPRFIRRSEVQKLTGLGASSIYQLQREGDFPQSVQLSERRVAWIESEVVAWINKRIANRIAANDEVIPAQGAE
ncbi:helix-turn-helix transcriptional regulator [Alkanindiges illinoisensis]|uniref:AlpA family transcriptional regulator n=1 Tax=Alkanindiges illinoisensis TaxID=197183 RepID=A0A4Y7XCF1_9GAMM|nr:AlpA family transcriptional regulator [Alkanindiges illinoisensis]TEU25527.1 AlpA family transcriptional regulator [Alkanindiges illinoisensis]